MKDPDELLTQDEILRGRLLLWQPKRGYRFNVDSLLLAHFVLRQAQDERTGAPLGRVADLCAGVGVIGLALAERDPAATVTLVELMPRAAALARRNADENRLGARVQVVEGDLADAAAMRRLVGGGRFDLVVSSPPFFSAAAGPTVEAEDEAVARHELRLTLADLCREARRLLVPAGRLALIHVADRLPEILARLEAERLRPTRLRAIHPRADQPAQRVLVEAIKGSRAGLTIEPPLVVRDGADYTAEVRVALGE